MRSDDPGRSDGQPEWHGADVQPNGTVWITEPFWKASDRYQEETGEVLCRMTLGAQAF